MVDARLVANRFLELAKAKGRTLTPMQVLKLVYIAHGWSLGLRGRPLISQPVEAWQYGPVIRDLYNSMRGYGGGTVAGPLAAGWGAPATELDAYERNLVDQVFDLYGHMSGPALSRITHADNTPWQQTYRPGVHGSVISTDAITDHYQRLSRERAPANG